MHIKKTHGCHPAGGGCTRQECSAQITYANLISGSILDITVDSGNATDGLGTSAIGHFTMSFEFGNDVRHFRFLKNPIFVNGCKCEDCKNIPRTYSSQWKFKASLPPKGTWFDVWIAIYWNCGSGDFGKYCYSQNVHYRDQVR
ncbi:8496_t:CDS:2 [Acaulospora morrowiae]|uniref:8496_t:CDS:1 n=1 Tax=Acaulospora morrowiae TaxID=94023 RepID=A0A9N9FU55_9GLOM|nr:8496_t:CDS:2 [Acaulospora morrowiae]